MLRLRKVTEHVHAKNAYRVVITLDDGSDLEIGSIGLQRGAYEREFWAWGLDSIVDPQPFPLRGHAKDREDAMRQFKAMWDQVATNPAVLAQFLTYQIRSRDRSLR